MMIRVFGIKFDRFVGGDKRFTSGKVSRFGGFMTNIRSAAIF